MIFKQWQSGSKTYLGKEWHRWKQGGETSPARHEEVLAIPQWLTQHGFARGASHRAANPIKSLELSKYAILDDGSYTVTSPSFSPVIMTRRVDTVFLPCNFPNSSTFLKLYHTSNISNDKQQTVRIPKALDSLNKVNLEIFSLNV